MPENKDAKKDFMLNVKDFGKEPLSTPLTEEQRKLAALSMAVNGAVIQFVLEGVIPIEEQIHFMMHVGDFAERLYRGEAIQMPQTKQTMNVNSEAGYMYAMAAIEELENGHKNFLKMKERAAQFEASEQETTLSEGGTNNVKPTVH